MTDRCAATVAGDTIARAKAFAKGQTLGRLSWQKLRDEGRR